MIKLLNYCRYFLYIIYAFLIYSFATPRNTPRFAMIMMMLSLLHFVDFWYLLRITRLYFYVKWPSRMRLFMKRF